MGEYAVLEGAPALVAAVNRRAHATISAGPAGAVRVVAPDVDLDAVATVHDAGRRAAAPTRGARDQGPARNPAPAQKPPAHTVTWDREVGERGRVISMVLGRYPTDGITLTLDTSGFFEPGRGKLGIGSSAAITVAAAGLLAAKGAYAAASASLAAGPRDAALALGGTPAGKASAITGMPDDPTPTLAELVHLHRDLQGGHGSGSDIAASLHGGVILYRTGAADSGDTQDTAHEVHGVPHLPARGEHLGPAQPTPTATSAHLPEDLHWCCVYAGRATSTASYLSAVRDWRSANPQGYRTHMGELIALAEAAEALLSPPAATQHDATKPGHSGAHPSATAPAASTATTLTADLLALIADYSTALERFGQAAGIDIVSADHAALRNQARELGVVYKPSGAGGGDVGVAFARDVDHIAAFQRRASALGYSIIDMSIDFEGLTVSGWGVSANVRA